MCNLFKDILMALTIHVVHNSTGAWSNYDQVCTYVGNNNILNDSDCKMLLCERWMPNSGMLKCKSICILELMEYNLSIYLSISISIYFVSTSIAHFPLPCTHYSSHIKPPMVLCIYKLYYPLCLSTYSTHFLEVPHSPSLACKPNLLIS